MRRRGGQARRNPAPNDLSFGGRQRVTLHLVAVFECVVCRRSANLPGVTRRQSADTHNADARGARRFMQPFTQLLFNRGRRTATITIGRACQPQNVTRLASRTHPLGHHFVVQKARR